MAKQKQQTPEAKPSFWKSPSGIATGVALGVGTVGAIMTMSKKASASTTTTTTPALPPGTTPTSGPVLGTTNGQGQTTYLNFQPGYYLFNVTSKVNPTAWLTAAGFGQIQTELDPFDQTQSQWLVSAFWTAPAASGTTLLDGGPATWTINQSAGLPVFLGTVAPPTPQPYNGLVPNNFYTFTIRTAFLQSKAGASDMVSWVLQQAGWSGTQVTAAADPSTSPDTWNVAAMWAQGTGQTQDAPPLWLFITAPVDVGTTAPPKPGTAMP